MDPVVKKENWDKFWNAETTTRFTKQSWSKIRIMQTLDPFLRPEMNVLDAGSGSGFFSNYFLSKGCRVWSLDYSEASLAITRKSTSNQCQDYLRADLLEEGWMGPFQNKFDLIFTDGLFEHFPEVDQRRLMDHFKMLKKKDGIVATFVPNRRSWWQVVRPLVMPGIKETPFVPEQLAKLHDGIRILKTGGLNVLPFRFSPEKFLGSKFGMILFCLAA